MNLTAVGAEIEAALGALTNMRVRLWTANNVAPPTAVIGLPDQVSYDQTYGRGVDRIDRLPLAVITGKPNDDRAAARAAELADGSGPASVKVALESATYASCSDVHVVNAQFDVITISGIEYVAAMFEIDIVGPGS